MVFSRLQLDEVNRAHTTVDGIAGKSVNVAKVLRALGADAFATGFAGGPRGVALERELKERGIEAEFIPVAAPTRQCITVIDESQATQTELVEESRAVEAAHYDTLLGLIHREMPKVRAVVLSGTLTPGAPVDFYSRCVAGARQAGVFSVVDAQGPALLATLSAEPDLVKPNRKELAATVGSILRTDHDVRQAMLRLKEAGASRVVVTAGATDCFAFDGTSFWRISNPAIKALNPIGSGDAFTAGITWSLLRGDDLGEACRWGAAAGAANALTLMAGELDLAEVSRLAAMVQVQVGQD